MADSQKKLTIGCAMIAKNEMEFIARALDSAKGADQIVVCDTGSTDNGETVRIAKEHGAEVYEDYKWEDSFAKARNHVKSKMKTDWIFSLDCDEFIHDFDAVRRAVEYAEANNIRAIDILQIAEDHTNQTNVFPRLFRNDPDIVWHGAAHNYISVIGILLIDDNGVIKTALEHTEENKAKALVRLTFGYSLAHFGDKDRTMRILEKAVLGGDPSAGAREKYYLAREYYYRNLWEKATAMFGKYVQESNFLQEKADAFLMMSISYWNRGMGEDARDACLQAIKINPHFKEAVYWMSQIVWPHHAEQWRNMARTANNRDVLFRREITIPDEPRPLTS